MFIEKLLIFWILSGSLTLLAQPIASQPSAKPTEATTPDNALQHYLHNGDNSFHWEIRDQYDVNQATVYDLLLVSQTWRDIKWEHELSMVVPKDNQYDGGLLMIVGGHDKNGIPE